MIDDPEFIELFRDETSDRLRDLRNALRLLYRDQSDAHALQSGRRAAHTIRGSAGLMARKEISKLAGEIEDGLYEASKASKASNGKQSLSVRAVVHYARLAEQIKAQVP